jgi:hypothetical protein
MRLLMLRGYAQNDEILQAKSRRFIGYMQSAYPHAKFIWANGPVQLHPGDVTENSEDQNENSQEGKSAIHFRAWFHQHVPGTSFQEVSDSLAYLAELLQTYGPFDGVVGFSQGSIMAVLLASLLQGDVRRKSYEALPHSSSDKILPYPREFSHLAHPPLKFGILFCPGLLRTGMEWLWGKPCTLNAVLSLRWGMGHCRERPTTRNRTRDNSYQGLCHGGPSGQPLSPYKRRLREASAFPFRWHLRPRQGGSLFACPRG